MIERRRVAVCVLAITGLVAATARTSSAQPNDGRIRFNVGLDASHAYFFRGIRQERTGVILQPYADATFTLAESDRGVGRIGLTVGQWNSIHTNGRGATNFPHRWYESDFFTGFTLGLANWQGSLVYTAYMSPSHAFSTVKELSISLGLDDEGVSALPLLLRPHTTLAIELDGQADGGASEGVYVELGIEPGVDFADGFLSLALPLTLGMSLSDYYEDGGGTDDLFGYVDLGLVLSKPLSSTYGTWELTGGVHMLYLGPFLKALNGGNEYQVVTSLGLAIAY